MRKSAIILGAAIAALLCCGFVKAPKRIVAEEAEAVRPDSLQALYLYTDALKKRLIEGDNAQAVDLLNRALIADSTYAPAWYELAELWSGTDIGLATEMARTAAELDSTNKWYLGRYGQALIMSRRYAEAVPVYEKLVRAGKDPDSYRLLAGLYEQNGRPFSAIAILDSADGQFGALQPLTDIKRRLLLSTRQYDRALEEAQKAVEAIPYASENHVALGEVYEMRGEDSLALASFRRAVEVDSTDIFAWAALGDYYLRRNDHHANMDITQHLFENDDLPLGEKLDMFRRLTADRRFYREYYPQINRLAATLFIKYPDDGNVIEMYAQHLIASGQAEQALAIYKSHLDDRPPVMEHYTMVTAIESYLGRPDSVEYYMDLTLARFPGNPEAHIARGGRYYSDGLDSQSRRNTEKARKSFDRALDCFDTALKLASTDSLRSDIWGYIGDIYHSAGDRKRCYAAYKKALKYDADNVSVLNNYAYYLSVEGANLDSALAMSKRVIELSQNNPTYLDTYAWVLYRLGRFEEAKQYMHQAISLDRSNSPELRLHYGDILAALGDNYMAEVYWRRALEAGYTDTEAIAARIENLKNTAK